MMDKERLRAEQDVLSRKLPGYGYRFMDMETSKPYIVLPARTNRGNIYTIRIELDEFPNEIPKAFVTKMLKTKSGNPMSGCSAAMHTLTSEHGFTRICHYGSTSWTPMVSIYKIYVKCRRWLEMYELHLQTGHDMDYYLNHQE